MDTKNILFEIVFGTYENFLVGYYLELNDDDFKLKQSFAVQSHAQSVRCIASSGKLLASGSTDDSIQLFNVKTRCEIGSLFHHNGTITSLDFYDCYLMSSSDDKTICIWSTKNWQCMKTLSGHKKEVNCVSIHPSGKLALSVSNDKTLRTWNLIKGRSAYITNLGKESELVKWLPDGSLFAVVSKNIINVYSVENASVLHTIDFQHRICDLTIIKDSLCAVGGDGEAVCIYDLATGSLCHQFQAHEGRVKAVKSVAANDELFLATASSAGCVKVWHVDISEPNFQIRQVAFVETGSRPTCMTIIKMDG